MKKPSQELWFVGRAYNLDKWRLADANGMEDVVVTPFETPRAALAVATREASRKDLRITTIVHNQQAQEYYLLLTPIGQTEHAAV